MSSCDQQHNHSFQPKQWLLFGGRERYFQLPPYYDNTQQSYMWLESVHHPQNICPESTIHARWSLIKSSKNSHLCCQQQHVSIESYYQLLCLGAYFLTCYTVSPRSFQTMLRYIAGVTHKSSVTMVGTSTMVSTNSTISLTYLCYSTNKQHWICWEPALQMVA